MNRRTPGIALWATALVAVILLIVQSALAGSDWLTGRYLLSLALLLVTILGVIVWTRRSLRDISGPTPEPLALVLSGLAAMSLWAAALWLMDGTDHLLTERAGPIPLPTSLLQMSDSLFGIDVQRSAYELQVLFAVVLLPLLQSILLFGLVQPELGAWIGRQRSAVVVGLLTGLFLALTTVQDIAPALPWGLSALGGYIIVGIIAALTVHFSGSFWCGFAALSSFNYVTLRWSRDLILEFLGKSYFDVSWLTVIILGALGAVIMLQVLRFQTTRPPEPTRPTGSRVLWMVLPLLLILADAIVLAVLDLNSRG